MTRNTTPSAGAAPAPPIRLRVLGTLQATQGRNNANAVTQPRRLALLLYLVLAEPRGLHARDTLITLLWPEGSATQGRQALRNALHALRKGLGDGVLVTAGHDLVGVAADGVVCDLGDLDAALVEGRAEDALAMYQEIAAGFHVSDAPDFERWLDSLRARVRTRVVQGALACAQRAAAAGDRARAFRLALALHALDPDDEALLRHYLALALDVGDFAGAGRAYRAFTARLSSEYGAQPAPETVALMARLPSGANLADGEAAHLAVAVLPIVDASTDASSADLCQALGDGIIRRLTSVPGLRVFARGVVAPCRAPGVTPLAAARELGADVVVDAALTVSPGTGDLEVRLEVIRAPDGTLLRGTTLRAARRNLFALEGAATSAIMPLVGAAPDAVGHASAPLPQPTRDGEAYVLYVRGTYLFLRAAHVGGSSDDLHRSRDLFEEALALDPRFGWAYAGLSNYYAAGAARNLLRPFVEHFGHAIALSHRALELDPALAIPHVHFGVQAMYLECDWERAGREFAQAVALDPSYAEARRFLGIYLGAMGAHDAGLRELREAVRLEPQIPMFRNSLADALLATGEPDEALVHLQAALALDGGFRAARERVVRCFERTSRWDEAVAARRALDPPEVAQRFAAALEHDGAAGYRRERAAELRQQIARLADAASRAPEQAGDLLNPPELRLALAHAELGEWAEASAWEERAAAAHAGRRQWFIGRPELAPLAEWRRADQRAEG